jgi:hypothetical protein
LSATKNYEEYQMALIWSSDENVNWSPFPLKAREYQLSIAGIKMIGNKGANKKSHGLLLAWGESGEEEWVLIADLGARIRVNAVPLIVGIRVLRNRDEILCQDQATGLRRYFFSTERLVQIEPFPALDGANRCPRCKQPINKGDMAVRCPNPQCRVWHHQKEDLPCWSYSPTCAMQCGWPTDLSAKYHWNPEEL